MGTIAGAVVFVEGADWAGPDATAPLPPEEMPIWVGVAAGAAAYLASAALCFCADASASRVLVNADGMLAVFDNREDVKNLTP